MAAQKTPTARPTHLDPATLRLARNIRVESTDEAEQADFEASIAAHGILQPLTVQVAPDGATEVVMGQRRLAAALKLGLPLVPVHYREYMDEEAAPVLQMIENIQRSAMTVAETAAAVWDIYNGAAGGSQQVVAELLGKPKSWVSKMMKVGADVPDGANSVAKGLMVANMLSDAEMAYTLCQIEEIAPAEAERIGGEIRDWFRAQAKQAELNARAIELAEKADATKDEAEALTIRAESLKTSSAADAAMADKVNHTRKTLRTALEQIKAAVNGTPSGDDPEEGETEPENGDGEQPGSPEDNPPAPNYHVSASDIEHFRFIRAILASAEVDPRKLDALNAARAWVGEMIDAYTTE